MGADESHSTEEAQPPSCPAFNTGHDEKASPFFWHESLAVKLSSSLILPLQRISVDSNLLWYSFTHRPHAEQKEPLFNRSNLP